MEKEEMQAIRYAGASSPGFKLTQGRELDYVLAIAVAKASKNRI